jgi:aminopeptidase YwaD
MKIVKINSKDVSDVLKKTDSIINAFGPRLPGSDACIQVAGQLKKEYAKYCDKVDENNYTQYPDSFFYMPFVIALTYILGSFLCCFHDFLFLSILIYFMGLVYLINQFIFFRDTFDRLFEKHAGRNVFGIIEPSVSPKQQIIISSHHDSPYICNFLTGHQKLYSFRLVLPMAFYLYALLTSILLTVSKAISKNASYHLISLIIILTGCFFTIPLFWYNSRKGSPGAGDNLNSSIIGIKIAEIIRKNFKSFSHTRLIFLSNDGEEIGQKGVKAFIKQNRSLLEECKTYVLNLDSIHKYDDLSLLTSDQNGTVNLSPKIADEILDISSQFNCRIQKKKLPFGGGGTDAAHFAKQGIESISLIGISTKFIRNGLNYHTEKDIVKNIDIAAVEAAMNIALNFILYKNMILEKTLWPCLPGDGRTPP